MFRTFCIGVFDNLKIAEIYFNAVQILSFDHRRTNTSVIVQAEERYTFQVNDLIIIFLINFATILFSEKKLISCDNRRYMIND